MRQPSVTGARVHPVRRALLLAGCLIVLVAIPAPGPASEPPARDLYRHPTPGYQFQFPRDHGSHPEFRTEWWYYTGHLQTKDGRRFGFQLTFFRRGVEREGSAPLAASQWSIRDLYFAHMALSDLDRGRFWYRDKISRAGLGKAGADVDHLHVWIDRWSLEATTPDPHRHRLKGSAKEFAIDLTVASRKPPVIHGAGGVSRKGSGPGQASHYYSLTRLETQGVLFLDGQELAVTGWSWMDHEFGSGELGADQVGWDWFGIQLDNGQELMFYQLRRADGTIDPASSGTLIDAEGRARALSSEDVDVSVLDHWTSRDSGARYPSGWKIAVPSLGLLLTVGPELANQELITRRSTQITYWEGASRITGTYRGVPVEGQGYVELTGYARPFRQRL